MCCIIMIRNGVQEREDRAEVVGDWVETGSEGVGVNERKRKGERSIC